jgi:hypothetical protein
VQEIPGIATPISGAGKYRLRWMMIAMDDNCAGFPSSVVSLSLGRGWLNSRYVHAFSQKAHHGFP